MNIGHKLLRNWKETVAKIKGKRASEKKRYAGAKCEVTKKNDEKNLSTYLWEVAAVPCSMSIIGILPSAMSKEYKNR